MYANQKIMACSSVFSKNFEYEIAKALRVLFWINSRNRSGVILNGLVGMFKLLANVIVLKYVYDTKEHYYFIIFPSWFSYKLKFKVTSSHCPFSSCRHVQAQLNTSPPAMVALNCIQPNFIPFDFGNHPLPF